MNKPCWFLQGHLIIFKLLHSIFCTWSTLIQYADTGAWASLAQFPVCMQAAVLLLDTRWPEPAALSECSLPITEPAHILPSVKQLICNTDKVARENRGFFKLFKFIGMLPNYSEEREEDSSLSKGLNHKKKRKFLISQLLYLLYW